VRDLWARRPLGASDSLVVDLGAHASALYRVGAPRQRSSGGASSP
jgi:hypothetical protein